MTQQQLEARLDKLIAYTRQLAQQHNELEKKINRLSDRVAMIDGEVDTEDEE
jgi:cell division protein FtsB